MKYIEIKPLHFLDQIYNATNEFCNICRHFCTNFNVFSKPSMFLHPLCLFSNYLRMIKTGRNVSGDLKNCEQKKINVYHLLVLFYELFIDD